MNVLRQEWAPPGHGVSGLSDCGGGPGDVGTRPIDGPTMEQRIVNCGRAPEADAQNAGGNA